MNKKVGEIESSLFNIVKGVNESSSYDENNPLCDVEHSLNLYFDTLVWLENSAKLLDTKINEYEKLSK
jgi:hypothetical protein